MTGASSSEEAVACRQVLEAIARTGDASPDTLRALATTPAAVLDETLTAFASDRGADALPALTALASDRAERSVRRAAKRALYRLAQRGIAPAPAQRRVVVVERQPERAVRAWISAIDGSGSRAVWIVFEAAYGGLKLCSLIVNDEIGIVEVAGGDITRKRLDRELTALRAEQKLPWVETEPARALGLVAAALTLHDERGTSPPADFARWRPFFSAAGPLAAVDQAAAPVDENLLERSTALLELPEMMGWFIDPESVQAEALEVLQARESRLVVSDQIKSEREEAILARALERGFPPDARTRWAHRLREMAWIFEATGRPEPARLATSAAAGFADLARDLRRHPLARAMARRALELAGEVALGRVSAAEVSRRPVPTRETPTSASPTAGSGRIALA